MILKELGMFNIRILINNTYFVMYYFKIINK